MNKKYSLMQVGQLCKDYFSQYKTKKEKFLIISMLILVIIEASFLYIQAWRIYKTKSSEDISIPAFILLIATNIAWIIYGWFILRDVPVIISGILYTIGAALVLTAIAMYHDQ